MKEINVAFEGRCDLKEKILNSLKKNYIVHENHNPQYLFYGWLDNEFLYYPDECIRISATSEDAIPNFNLCDYAIGTHRITFGERYFRYPFSYSLIKPSYLKNRKISKKEALNRKFCNFVYSRVEDLPAIRIREQFCKELSKYKKIDCPSLSLNNMNNPISIKKGNWIDNKINFLREYKFSISFENEYDEGYITEKLTHPFCACSVPIYMGAPDVQKDFNINSFIYVKSKENFEKIIDHIIYLDNNDDEYLELLNAPIFPPSFDIDIFDKKFEDFLINIIEKGKKYRFHRNKICDPIYHVRNEILLEIERDIIAPFHNNSEENAQTLLHNIEGKNYNSLHKRKVAIENAIKPMGSIINSYCNLKEEIETYISINENIDQKHTQLFNMILSTSGNKNKIFETNNDKREFYYNLLQKLWPYDTEERNKIRVGPKYDGGIIIIKPNQNCTIFSINVSNKPGYAERDYNLAEMGYKIIQYDSTFKRSPKWHPNIIFIRADCNNIDLLECIKAKITKSNLILFNTSPTNNDLLQNFSKNYSSLFEQIYLDISMDNVKPHIYNKTFWLYSLLKKFNPIHIHYNNNFISTIYNSFIIGSRIELTLLREDFATLKKSNDSFPTNLDFPNDPSLPDLYIGKFNFIYNN